jgi:hypothetical protein
LKQKKISNYAYSQNLLFDVLVILAILSRSDWNRVGLCARRALSSWGCTGVSSVHHIKAFVDLDGPEDLVFHHAARFKD